MLSKKLEDTLQYFDIKKYQINDSEVLLEEKSNQGKVKLKCMLDEETLIFHNPAQNVLPYLDGEKKHAKAAPDKFLFQVNDKNEVVLHIMEFKKSINTSTLKKSKIQFIMGIYNARAIAGFLGICIDKIYIYSAYRKDDIASLIEMRNANINADDKRVIKDWRNGKCVLTVDSKEVEFVHIKIQLDVDGNGECQLIK